MENGESIHISVMSCGERWKWEVAVTCYSLDQDVEWVGRPYEFRGFLWEVRDLCATIVGQWATQGPLMVT